MFALDLFNNDYERRLAEGAVDQLEQRRIDDLAMKMDDLVARAKQVKDPEHKAALVKEFQKVKAERDSYFKIKDEGMGYGGLGEENVNEGAMKDMLWDMCERMERDEFINHCVSEWGWDPVEMGEFWDSINGPLDEVGIGQDIVNRTEKMARATPSTPAGKVASTVKNAAKWLAGKGGPGKEGPTYEGKDDAWQTETPWKETPKAKSGKPVDPRGEVTHLSDVARREAVLKAQAQKKNPNKLDESQQLHQGDPIVVTAPNEFEGATGEIYEFSPSGKFVIVDLYNHGKHSMHLSDVEYNQYADDQDEDDWYDEEDTMEGWQDFNKVEPYAVCLAGKPVKKFDYYEQARRFHDNWKQKLYREGNKEKADKITLMPLNLDEGKWDYPKSMTTIPKYDKDADDYLALHQGAKFARKNKEDRKEWRKAAKAQAHKDLMTGKKDVAEAGSPAQQAAIAIAMKKAGKKPKSVDEDFNTASLGDAECPKCHQHDLSWEERTQHVSCRNCGSKFKESGKEIKQVDELDASTLKSYADKRGAQVAAMQADNPNPTTGSKEWIQQAVPAQQVSLAKRKIARKERQAGVTEDTGSWIVYDPETRQIKKRFKTHTAGKSYAKVHGLGFASSEYYFDNIKEKAVAEGQQPMNRNAVIQKLEAIYTKLYQDEDPESYDLPAAVDYWHSLPADQLAMEFEDAIDRLKQSRGSIDEAQTDYQKRRARERDVDAGRPVKPLPRNPQTDYARKRAKDKRDMELGEDEVDDFVKAGGKITYGKPQKGPRRPGLSLASRHIGGGGDKMKPSRTGRAGAAIGGKPVGIKEEQDNSGVERAILNRIMVAHTDLLKQFGPQKVMQAAEEVAYNVGDVDEIGTSDVSAYVNQVRQILGA